MKMKIKDEKKYQMLKVLYFNVSSEDEKAFIWFQIADLRKTQPCRLIFLQAPTLLKD